MAAPVGKAPKKTASADILPQILGENPGQMLASLLGSQFGSGGRTQIQNASGSSASVSVNPAITVVNGGGTAGVSTGGSSSSDASQSPSQSSSAGSGGGLFDGFGFDQTDPNYAPVTPSDPLGGLLDGDLLLPMALAAGAFFLTQT